MSSHRKPDTSQHTAVETMQTLYERAETHLIDFFNTRQLPDGDKVIAVLGEIRELISDDNQEAAALCHTISEAIARKVAKTEQLQDNEIVERFLWLGGYIHQLSPEGKYYRYDKSSTYLLNVEATPEQSPITDTDFRVMLGGVTLKTVNTLAEHIRRDLGGVKWQFRQFHQNNQLGDEVIREQLIDGLQTAAAIVKLLRFGHGVALLEEAVLLLQQSPDDNTAERFITAITALENALWAPQHLSGSASALSPTSTQQGLQSSAESAETAEMQGLNDEVSEDLAARQSTENVASNPVISHVDKELLSIFLGEGKSISKQLSQDMAVLIKQPKDSKLLQNMRRAYHTLKGSSRMLGFEVFGEFAWQHEKLLKHANEGVYELNVQALRLLHDSNQLIHQLTDESAFFENNQLLTSQTKKAKALLKELMSSSTDSTSETTSGETVTGHSSVDSTAEQAQQQTEKAAEKELEKIDPLGNIYDSLRLLHSRRKNNENVTQIGSDLFGFSTDDSAAIADKDNPTKEETIFTVDDPGRLDQAILMVFIEEAMVLINQLQDQIDQLSPWSLQGDHLNEIKRNFHTLKGSARMASVYSLGELAHRIESLLNVIAKDNEVNVESAYALLVEGVRLFRYHLQVLRGGVAISAPLQYINQLEVFIAEQQKRLPELLDTTITQNVSNDESQGGNYHLPNNVLVNIKDIKRLLRFVGDNVVAQARVNWAYKQYAEHLSEVRALIGRITRLSRDIDMVTETAILAKPAYMSNDSDFDPLELDRFTQLQQQSRQLMEVVHDFRGLSDKFIEFNSIYQEIGATREIIQDGIQETVQSVAMTDFTVVKKRIELITKQLSKRLGKLVNVEIYGVNTTIEKSTLESLIIAIEHALRNSLAHGIETPMERLSRGKSERGHITIVIRREGAEVWVVISDDGRGVDVGKIRKKAKGIKGFDISREHDDDYILNYLFNPGFTTEKQVNYVSGRGIGLDVVKEIVQSLNGYAQLSSRKNEGFTLTMGVPFGMSITRAVSIMVDNYHYAVPMASMWGTTLLSSEEYNRFLAGETVYHNYHDEDYLVMSMMPYRNIQQKNIELGVPCLLVQVGTTQIAIVISALQEYQNIVIEPGNHHLIQVPGIVGVTMIEKGEVLPVLDVAVLGRYLLLREKRTDDISPADKLAPPESLVSEKKGKLLAVDDSITMRQVVRRMLKGSGLTVKVAKDGLDALDVMKDWRPDIILLDIEMPKMDGFELMSYLGEREALADIPVIIITSRTSDKHKERAIKLGVKDFLSKPFSKEQLLASIEAVLVAATE